MIEARGKPVFVLSTGRSGSQMVVEVMRLHPHVCALHEPSPTLNTESYASWKGRVRSARLAARVAAKRQRLVSQITENGLLYFESSLFLSHLVPSLESIFAPKFVHLFRDGRDFILSGLTKGWYGDRDRQSPSARLKAAASRLLVVDIGNPGLDHRLSPPRSLPSRFERLAWLWQEVNESIASALASIASDRVYRLRLESIDESRIASLCEFVGVEAGQELLRDMQTVAASRPHRHREDLIGASHMAWSDWEKKRFAQIAGSTMRALGYDMSESITSQ